MKIENKGMAIELLVSAIPYSNQIVNIDLDKEDSVYFGWRGQRFKIELDTCSVWEVSGSILEGSNECILIRRLIELEIIKRST